ncbi:hypothetical protein NKR23_g2121 [Pleurostoma richardsiae]|uniref:Uncharacterized protein n=1 Tax=Pleurostoma richardsiae TaxID=41990 RepID=A0AA38S3L1_9PEZI|nr:hypothetical protein NKR23_g2121 [Pleurostoma richardsiae]
MPRGKNRNQNFKKGLQNRKQGFFKKGHTFHRLYPSEVAAVIRHVDGNISAYESHRGFLRTVSFLPFSEATISGPDDFDLVRERYDGAGQAPTGAFQPLTSTPPPEVAVSLPTPSTSSTPGLGSQTGHQRLAGLTFPMTPPLSTPFGSVGGDTSEEGRVTESTPTEDNTTVTPSIIFPSSLLPVLPQATSSAASSASPSLASTITRVSSSPEILAAPQPISIRDKRKLIALTESFFQD